MQADDRLVSGHHNDRQTSRFGQRIECGVQLDSQYCKDGSDFPVRRSTVAQAILLELQRRYRRAPAALAVNSNAIDRRPRATQAKYRRITEHSCPPRWST